MQTLALRRLRAIAIRPGSGIPAKKKLILLAELANLGYAVRNPDLLNEADEEIFGRFDDLVADLRRERGGNVDYVPLFTGFPERVPDDNEYFLRRLVGFASNLSSDYPDGEVLGPGWAVPRWLFDLAEFGADPISQMQTPSLFQRGREQQAARETDEHVEWIQLELVWQDELPDRLEAFLLQNLYARSSIKEELHEDLKQLLRQLAATGRLSGADGIVDFDRIAMHETKALVLGMLWQDGDLDTAAGLAKTPTDLLRLFAGLTESDVSLSSPIRFPKLKRRQRRAVLTVLERSTNLAEDLNRYRGLWLELGRYLHPGEYRRKFPHTAAAFDALRNGRISTFDSRTEQLLATHQLDSLLTHLQRRPGLLGRKVHELLRRFPGRQETVLEAFTSVVKQLPVKNLLILHDYFAQINGLDYRTVINKKGKIKVLPNNAKGALPESTIESVCGLLNGVLMQRLAEKPSFEGRSVWLDPALADYTVPLQQRAASDGLLTFGRGARLPVVLGKVLRLFIYWRQTAQRTDLDLSVIQFDADFRYLGHVSYTNLAAQGIVHSGDLQSAPEGAAEFIDITLDQLDAKVRHLAVQVNRYSGESFGSMLCHAGWMVRQEVDSEYQSFDIKTVANKFDLNGSAAYCVPLTVDLEAGQIVLTDLYMGSRSFQNNVEGAHGDVGMACREVNRFIRTRPTMARLAQLHWQARGGRSADVREAADITFGIRGCTYNAADIESILADLL